MRISDMEGLPAAYKRDGIDSAPYYRFSDCEHGGYGLGVEVCLIDGLAFDTRY